MHPGLSGAEGDVVGVVLAGPKVGLNNAADDIPTNIAILVERYRTG